MVEAIAAVLTETRNAQQQLMMHLQLQLALAKQALVQRQLCHLHHSSSGAGTTAAVPVRARQSLSLDGRAPPALDTGRLVGRRVLLAEDNLINQTVARKMLSSLGMHVEVAVNGLEALHAVQRKTQQQPPALPTAPALPLLLLLLLLVLSSRLTSC
ncbi:hypothetical protein COO60DRAFT_949999 [Scenedesmus sp. NREL 46B-D3]|nr:hypothetical protein COO60DRAFT_949999 [Scenedesmus sp. NREL 46B-D3]